VAIANALQFEAARSAPVLFRINYDAMPSLTSLNLPIAELYRFFAADTLLYVVSSTDLWSWPSTFDLEHLQCIICDVTKLGTTYERNRAIRGGVIAILVFDFITLNIATCCARLWYNFHQIWSSTTYPCL